MVDKTKLRVAALRFVSLVEELIAQNDLQAQEILRLRGLSNPNEVAKVALHLSTKGYTNENKCAVPFCETQCGSHMNFCEKHNRRNELYGSPYIVVRTLKGVKTRFRETALDKYVKEV